MGKIHRIRTRAREIFTKVLPTSITKCHWCKRPIMWHRKLKQPVVADFKVSILNGRFDLPIGTVDHVTPICDGGTNSIDNLVGSCIGCNSRKENWSAEKFADYTKRFFGGRGL